MANSQEHIDAAQQEPVALPEKIYEFVPTPEPAKWHHPECEGECIACLIERVVQEAYGSQGLGYLQRHLTSPPPCPTCEALARTVMLDQTSHDTHRKPTDEMVVAAARMLSDRQAAACNVDCGDMWKLHGNDFIDDARAALEAAHGIKENT